MPQCTNCGAPREQAANFCSNCGEPQNETARNRLNQVINRRAQQQTASATQAAGGSTNELIPRVSYALGFVFAVVGLSVIPAIGGFLVLLGGILLFPPIRTLTGRVLGSPLKLSVHTAVAVVFVLLGTVLYYFL